MFANQKLLLSLAWLSLAVPVMAQSAGTIVVTDLGAKSDGTDPAGTTKAFLQAFSQCPSCQIVVPPGNYALNNSNGGLFINNFSGEFLFQGGATLIFQDISSDGLQFFGGTGARVTGLHATYVTPPTARVGNQLCFNNMTDLVLKDVLSEYSNGSGIWIAQCIRPKVINAHVTNALADGLAFVNSQDAQVANLTTLNTHDNGLAFYTYSGQASLPGGSATNIHVTNSHAHGIAVVGTSFVTVSGFTIDTTQASAVFVGADAAYSMLPPDHVLVQNGTAINAGQLPVLPGTNPGNPFGIEYNTPVSAMFANIEIVNAKGRSVSGTAPSGKVFLNNIRSRKNAADGDFVFYQTGYVDVSDSSADNGKGTGFAFDTVGTAIANRLKSTNQSQTNSLHRAVWFQNGLFVSGHELLVTDTQATPTGNVVGTADGANKQKGAIHGVAGAVLKGSVSLQNYSPGVVLADQN